MIQVRAAAHVVYRCRPSPIVCTDLILTIKIFPSRFSSDEKVVCAYIPLDIVPPIQVYTKYSRKVCGGWDVVMRLVLLCGRWTRVDEQRRQSCFTNCFSCIATHEFRTSTVHCLPLKKLRNEYLYE